MGRGGVVNHLDCIGKITFSKWEIPELAYSSVFVAIGIKCCHQHHFPIFLLYGYRMKKVIRCLPVLILK